MTTIALPSSRPAPAGPRPPRWTCAEFHRFGDMGVFEGRRAMLIDGVILEEGPMNPPHAITLELVEEALRLAFGPGWRFRSQSPLVLGLDLDPEPDFAVIMPDASRRLICGRCVAQWSFGPLTCPFCSNDDRALVTSFATRDGRYRVYGCDVCRRYLKAYDARNAVRPVMVTVDTIATLPLDAAAIQRGYVG